MKKCYKIKKIRKIENKMANDGGEEELTINKEVEKNFSQTSLVPMSSSSFLLL